MGFGDNTCKCLWYGEPSTSRTGDGRPFDLFGGNGEVAPLVVTNMRVPKLVYYTGEEIRPIWNLCGYQDLLQ